ncbi:MAG: O-antigen ligase family protein [Armatimonadota bacterium]
MKYKKTETRQESGGFREEQQWTPERISAVTRNTLVILLFGVFLGLFTAAVNLYYVAAAIFGAVLVFVTAWHFEAAIALYVLVAFIPWGETPDLAVGGSGVGKGVFISEIMLGFLLVVWAGKYFLRSLPKMRISSGFYVPMALYLAYCVLNVVNSLLFWDVHVNKMFQKPQVNVIELGLHVLSAGALIMIATSVSNRKWLRIITLSLIAACSYNLFNTAIGNRIPLEAPWSSLLIVMTASYCCAVALHTRQWNAKRIGCLAVVALSIVIVVVLGISWVSGWLAMLAALGTVVFLSNRKLFYVTAVCVSIIILVAWPFLHANVVEQSKTEGDFDRFSLMNSAMKYATTFPLGVGLGNYRTYNSFYYGEKWGTTTYSSAHGTYSQHLAETGIPGTVLFLGILVQGFLWLKKNYHRISDSFSRAYILAAMGQMVGISAAAILGDYIIPTYHNGGLITFSTTVYSWLIWGLAVAHVRLAGTSGSECL